MIKKLIILIPFILSFNISNAYSHEGHKHEHNPKNEHQRVKNNIKVKNTKDEKLKVSLLPKMDSYPKLKPIKFTLNVLNNGKPLNKANIVMDLTMPDMAMPKNEIKFKQISNGVYESEGIFTMSGNWVLVTVIEFNNRKEVKKFNVVVG